MVKLYPQGNAEARFKMNGVKKIYLYCNRSGLFYLDVVKGIVCMMEQRIKQE